MTTDNMMLKSTIINNPSTKYHHFSIILCVVLPPELLEQPKDRIEQLKAMIWAHDTDYVVERQKLVFNGTELRDNDCTCSHYGLGDSDHIELYEVARQKRKREET